MNDKKPEEKNMIDLANEAKNTVYNAAGISNTEKLEIIEAEQKGEQENTIENKIAQYDVKPKKMGLFKKMAFGLGCVGGFLGLVTGGSWGLHSLIHHNDEYKSSSVYSMAKVDGPFFLETEVRIDDGKTKMTRTGGIFAGLFSEKNKRYIDEDSDGKVDKLKIYNWAADKGTLPTWFDEEDLEQEFDRSKHYEKHADKFLEADKDFQEQLERFKPHIDEWKKQSGESSTQEITDDGDSTSTQGVIDEFDECLNDVSTAFAEYFCNQNEVYVILHKAIELNKKDLANEIVTGYITRTTDAMKTTIENDKEDNLLSSEVKENLEKQIKKAEDYLKNPNDDAWKKQYESLTEEEQKEGSLEDWTYVLADHSYRNNKVHILLHKAIELNKKDLANEIVTGYITRTTDAMKTTIENDKDYRLSSEMKERLEKQIKIAEDYLKDPSAWKKQYEQQQKQD